MKASVVLAGGKKRAGMFLTKVLLLFTILPLGNKAVSQNKFTDNLNAQLNFHAGYSIPEYAFVSAYTNDYIRSVNLSVFKETAGKNSWQQIYNYPEYGISLFYSTLGNKERFGNESSLTYFVRLYFLNRNRFRMYNHVGFGGGYTTRKFDPQTNVTNVAVGSHLNFHFNYRLGATFAIDDRSKVHTGLSFDHLSNANTAEPNLGLNYLTAYAGLSSRIGKKSERQFHELTPIKDRNSMAIFGSVAGKHSRALSSSYFLATSLSLALDRTISRKVHLGAGADFFYDSSVESSFERDDRDYRKSYSYQTGIHISQTLVFNRFSLSIQEGVYLFLTEQVDRYKFYNRGILQFRLSDHFSVRLAMKSHLYILDYPELGLGYHFKL